MPPKDDRARRQALLALGAALITVTLWASAFVGIRSAGRDLSPGALTLCRLLVGSAVLGALVLVRREPLPARRDLPGIVLCGLLWFGVYNVALNEAERRVELLQKHRQRGAHDACSNEYDIRFLGGACCAHRVPLRSAPTSGVTMLRVSTIRSNSLST